jgi:hypothetical protein
MGYFLRRRRTFPPAHRCLVVAPLLGLLSAAPARAQTTQPAAQGWAGWAQCQIAIQGPGYSHNETHLWTITAAGAKQANMEIYPTTWTVTGGGSLQRVNGPTTVSAQWTGSGTLQNVTIGFTLHLDRITFQRWTGHGPVRGAFTGTEVSTTNGNARSRFVVLDVQQWSFPAGEGAITSTRMNGSSTLPFDGLRGPMNPPSGAMGTATCSWDFARGGSTPAPAPVVTTPAAPPSGGSVSGGAPSGGAGGTGSTTSGSAGGPPANATAGGAGTGGGNTGGTGSGGRAGGSGRSGNVAVGPTTADLAISFFGTSDPTGLTVPSSWPANGTARYGLGVVNLGPGSADGTTITVPASVGLTKTSVSCAGQQGVQFTSPTVAQIESGFAIATLPGGLFLTCQILATVTGAAGSSVTMSVDVTAPGGVSDPNPGNNTAAKTVPIIPASSAAAPPPGGANADLQITLVPSDPATSQPVTSWPAGGTGRYAMTVRNNGPGDVSRALFTVSASAGLTYPWGMNGVCPPPTSCPGFGMPLLQGGVTIPGLPAGASFQITLSGSVSGAVGTSVGVTATITPPAGVVDPNPGNNSAGSTQMVVAASATP